MFKHTSVDVMLTAASVLHENSKLTNFLQQYFTSVEFKCFILKIYTRFSCGVYHFNSLQVFGLFTALAVSTSESLTAAFVLVQSGVVEADKLLSSCFNDRRH